MLFDNTGQNFFFLTTNTHGFSHFSYLYDNQISEQEKSKIKTCVLFFYATTCEVIVNREF